MKIINVILLSIILAILAASIPYLIINHLIIILEVQQKEMNTMLPSIKKVTYANLIENNTLIAQSPLFIPEIKVYATITAYNPTTAQCDSTPDIMASGKKVYEGAIACPRKLEFGTRIEIDGIVYICEDRLSKKYNDRYDIFMFSYEEAIEYGKQKKEVLIY